MSAVATALTSAFTSLRFTRFLLFGTKCPAVAFAYTSSVLRRQGLAWWDRSIANGRASCYGFERGQSQSFSRANLSQREVTAANAEEQGRCNENSFA